MSPGWERQLETWAPDTKLHLNAHWQGRRLGVNVRATYYGEVTDVGPTAADDLDVGDLLVIDLDVAYALTESTKLRLGLHNLRDEYPDVRPRDTAANRILPYSNYSPFGFNGRLLYLRFTYDL